MLTEERHLRRTDLRAKIIATAAAVLLSGLLFQGAAAQRVPGTDVYLAGLDVTDRSPTGIAVASARNITHRAGYDNQPAFIADERAVFFTSIRQDGQADIYRYDIASGRTTRITSTRESEYSPTPMPGGQRMSVVRVEADSTQRLWSFALDGSKPALVLRSIKPVGYHVWLDATHVAVYVLGAPATLQVVDTKTERADTVARDIDRSLSPISVDTVSFVQRHADSTLTLTRLSISDSTGVAQVASIATLPRGATYVVWTSTGVAITAAGSKLYTLRRGEAAWRQAADLASDGLAHISRLAISPNGHWLALVADDAQQAQMKPWPVVPSPYVEGYDSTLAGERFSYHTASPLITTSLLVRSSDSTRYIEWRTAPVPDSAAGPFVTFRWMASMDVVDPGTTQHRFTLALNGRPWFTIPSPLSATPADWRITGRDSSTLSFHTLLVDWAGDVNGLMTMRVPLADLERGAPVTLRVTGESAGSQAWYMTFTHPVAPVARLSGEQALLRGAHGAEQSLRVGIWSLAASNGVAISVNGVSRLTAAVAEGWNVLEVPIPQVTRPALVAVTLAANHKTVHWDALPVAPVIPRTIYLIPHAHLDIGYNVLQQEAERRHQETYRDGIALARKTASYPRDARFHWNVEGLWPMENLLNESSAAERDTLLTAARNGALSLNAFYANLMTGLSRPEELEWSIHYATELRRRHGIPINTAITSDVPGFTWGVVPMLAQNGIRYLSSGPNYVPGSPDGGDRIGRLLQTWGDSAFYWMSPSGRDSVLVMIAGRGYSWFHGRRRGWAGLADQGGLIDYMDSLAVARYPWRIVQVRYTTGDNGSVDSLLPDAVRRWNRTYVSPHVVIGTLPHMFADFEHRYAKQLRRVRGDLTGYWEDGAQSTARETALSRNAAERLTQAGTLCAMLRASACATEAWWPAWRDVLLYTEHTWGADRSISAPDDPFVLAQWAVKRGFAVSADSASHALLDSALGPRTVGNALDVFNTSSWPRSGVVTVSDSLVPDGGVLSTSSGRAVPAQHLRDGRLAFLAEDVPPLGRARYLLAAGARPAAPLDSTHASGDSIWNGEIMATVDTITGALASVRWKGHELVDRTRGGWGDYWYVPARSSTAAVGVHGVTITVLDSGPLVASLRVTSSAPGARSLTRTYRVTSGSDAVEISATIDKRAVRTKEAVHIGFPFLVPNGQVRLDVPWAIVRPDSDQLPGANRNVLTADRWADVSNDSIGVQWATLDAPLVELGGMTAEDWHHDDGTTSWLRALPRTQLLFSYVMNNYWHTNFKADQSGPVTFRYAVRPHGAWDAGAAERFGIGESQPLIVAPATGGDPAEQISISDPDVIVASVTSVPGGLRVRLFNPTRATRRVELRCNTRSVRVTMSPLGTTAVTIAAGSRLQ